MTTTSTSRAQEIFRAADIPTRQTVVAIAKDGKTTTTEFKFSNIELL